MYSLVHTCPQTIENALWRSMYSLRRSDDGGGIGHHSLVMHIQLPSTYATADAGNQHTTI